MGDELKEFRAKIEQAIRGRALPARPTMEKNPARRAENLMLLRAFLRNPRQEDMAVFLKLGSQSFYSEIERGNKELPEGNARQIEADLELPAGWFERNNADTIFLSQNELDLILELRGSAEAATKFLLNALKSLHTARD